MSVCETWDSFCIGLTHKVSRRYLHIFLYMYECTYFLRATRFPHYRQSVIKTLPRSHQDERPRNGHRRLRSCRYLFVGLCIDADTHNASGLLRICYVAFTYADQLALECFQLLLLCASRVTQAQQLRSSVTAFASMRYFGISALHTYYNNFCNACAFRVYYNLMRLPSNGQPQGLINRAI